MVLMTDACTRLLKNCKWAAIELDGVGPGGVEEHMIQNFDLTLRDGAGIKDGAHPW
jgi:hypothetical protein